MGRSLNENNSEPTIKVKAPYNLGYESLCMKSDMHKSAKMCFSLGGEYGI